MLSPAPASPEEAFFAWLLWLEPGRDPRHAARAELARLDARAPLAPPARRLRELFATLAAPPAGGRTGEAPGSSRDASRLPTSLSTPRH